MLRPIPFAVLMNDDCHDFVLPFARVRDIQIPNTIPSVQRLPRVLPHRLEIVLSALELPLERARERLERLAPRLDLFKTARGSGFGPVDAEHLDTVAGRGDVQVPAVGRAHTSDFRTRQRGAGPTSTRSERTSAQCCWTSPRYGRRTRASPLRRRALGSSTDAKRGNANRQVSTKENTSVVR